MILSNYSRTYKSKGRHDERHTHAKVLLTIDVGAAYNLLELNEIPARRNLEAEVKQKVRNQDLCLENGQLLTDARTRTRKECECV